MAIDDYDSQDSKIAGGVTPPKSVEELRRQMEDGRNQLQSLKLENDAQGNGYIFGIKVSKNIRPFIELGLENIKPYILDQGEKVYSNAAKLGNKMSMKSHSHTFGAAVENIFRWSVIGAQPISGFVSASRRYSKERSTLFHELEPVINATKANAHNNEVIKAAFDGIHQNWSSDMKMLASDIPTLIPMAMIGWQGQVSANKRHKESKAKVEKLAERAQDNGGKPLAPHEQKKLERDEFEKGVLEDVKRKERLFIENYVKENKDSIGEGKAYANEDALLSKAKEAAKEYQRDWRSEAYEDRREDKSRDKENAADSEEKSEAMLKFAVPLTSAASQVLKSNIETGQTQRHATMNAWKLIKNLRTQVDEQCGGNAECNTDYNSRSADEIKVTLPGKENQEMSIADYVIEIFKQNEIDNHRTGLGNNLITQLRPSAEIIANYIADGSLDANALVNLVGENKVIIHSGSARRFASESQVRTAIDQLEPVLSTHEKINPEDFFANFADPRLIQETLKNDLVNMKGQEKALFVSLFPDDILEQAGLRKRDIINLRREAHEHLNAFVVASAIYIGGKNPEEMQKLGLSDIDIQAINDFTDKIKSGDQKEIDAAINGRNKSVISAVRTAVLTDQVGGGKSGGSWVQRVKASEVEKQAADAKAEQQEEKKDDGVIASASKKIGDGLNDVSVPAAGAIDREMKKRSEKGEPSEGVAV